MVPGSGGLQTLIERGDAMELNHDLLPNLRNLKPAFADPDYDPGNRYSVPKDYGITSFWWRAEAVKEDPRTMEEAFALLSTLKGANGELHREPERDDQRRARGDRRVDQRHRRRRTRSRA